MPNDVPSPAQEKKLARLAAVQALYQMTLTQRTAKQVLAEHQGEPQAFLLENAEIGLDSRSMIDKALFEEIVVAVEREAKVLDDMISGAASSHVSAERMEILLRTILRAGLYELQRGGDVSVGVVINDYVDIAHAYFDAKEPGLVNAILDRVAKTLRQT
ncbi:MAG: transcription antitermination factor NusB [Bdellovibrionales bacterium]